MHITVVKYAFDGWQFGTGKFPVKCIGIDCKHFHRFGSMRVFVKKPQKDFYINEGILQILISKYGKENIIRNGGIGNKNPVYIFPIDEVIELNKAIELGSRVIMKMLPLFRELYD